MKHLKIDKTWTLFLDRDGVINKKIDNDYVKKIQELELLPNSLIAIKNLSDFFQRVLIVTNQRGIGRNLMTENDLNAVHSYLLKKIKESGGRISKIYFCPHLDNTCDCRKPGPGMGLKAKNDFPQINFQKSIIVGDSISDMGFGKNLNMTTVFISNKCDKKPDNADFVFASLYDFAESLVDSSVF